VRRRPCAAAADKVKREVIKKEAKEAKAKIKAEQKAGSTSKLETCMGCL